MTTRLFDTDPARRVSWRFALSQAALVLKVSDIDSKRMVIHVRSGDASGTLRSMQLRNIGIRLVLQPALSQVPVLGTRPVPTQAACQPAARALRPCGIYRP